VAFGGGRGPDPLSDEWGRYSGFRLCRQPQMRAPGGPQGAIAAPRVSVTPVSQPRALGQGGGDTGGEHASGTTYIQA